MTAGDLRPGAAGARPRAAARRRSRSPPSAARVPSRAAMAAGSAPTASAPGAPMVRASASDISTGVPWASARASGPLEANGRGYGSSATSAAVNQRADVLVGHEAGEAHVVRRRRAQALGVVVAQPRVLAAGDHELDRVAGQAGGADRGLEPLVGGDEAEAQDAQRAVVDAERGERRLLLGRDPRPRCRAARPRRRAPPTRTTARAPRRCRPARGSSAARWPRRRAPAAPARARDGWR